MENIWYKSYDLNVPKTIELDQYDSILQILEEAFKKYQNDPCFINFGSKLTFKEVDRLSSAFAGYLQSECGLEKGDRIAMIMPNILQYPVALFGALRAGLIVANFNPLSTYHELNAMLIETDAKCVVVFSNIANVLQLALKDTKIEHVIVVNISDLFGTFRKVAFNFFVKKKKMITPWHIPNAIMFEDAIKFYYRRRYNKPEIDPEDIALLQYTDARESSFPKCVMLTHQNLIANILQCSVWLDAFLKKEAEAGVMNILPIYHVFSLIGNVLIFMRYGFVNILITNPLDISYLIKECTEHPFSVLLGVNGLFNSLLQNKNFNELNFSDLKLVIGAGAMQGTVISKWKALTGVMILEGYGSTETSLVSTLNPLSLRTYNSTVGLPLPSTEVKICNEDGEELPLDTVGELWIKGPQIMKGYWKNPEKTKEVLTEDGWLRSGDLASINEKGFLRIIDRISDTIVIGANKIYPNQIDDIIAAVKGVSEVVVVGIKFPDGVQRIKAFVVKKDPNLTAEAILAHCRQFLPDYQVPYEVEFRTALPKTYVGNMLRRVLREEVEKVKK